VWIFGWNKVSKRFHAISIWLVAVATNLSALWILLANGWMQHPVGYVLRNGRAEMVDFMAMVTNPYGLLKFAHTLLGGYTLAAFFVLGISAYHLLKKNETDFFKSSFGMAAKFALASTLLVLLIGDFHTVEVAKTQPAKFAAMESVWETRTNVGFNIFVIPDAANECNLYEKFCIPNMLSYLAFHSSDAEIKGLKSFPRDERPPVAPVFFSYRLMVVLGLFFILAASAAVIISARGTLEANPLFLKILLYSIPLPYIANQLGWLVAEVGRQPWIVYGVMKTSDAVSRSISLSQVVGSLIGFTLLYSLLGFIDIFLLAKFARQGPDNDLTSIIKLAGKEV
jgi:cytochrome d ubiquinol oxidase subunit I